MEWEKKFYDIVRETESNLANARQKLQGSGMARNSYTHMEYFCPSPRNSFQASTSTSFVNNNDNINSIRRQMGWSQPLLSQPGSLSATALPIADSSEMRELKTKIDSQNLMIEKLERLVRTLNHEKDQYRKQIRDLQSEVGNISTKLSESRLVDPHLETQVDLMRHEVRSDMQRLQDLINSSKTSSLYSSTLERSFRDMQHHVHSELEDLRRDLNSMTQRVGRLELDVSTHSLSQSRQRDSLSDRLKGDVLSSSARLGQSSSFLNNRPSLVMSGDVFQLKELRSTVSELHNKLDSLESRLVASRTSPPVQTSLLFKGFRKSPTKSYRPAAKVAPDIFEDNDDDSSDLDDLDLSGDLDLDAASDADSELTLSGKLEELVNVGKMDVLKTKSPERREGWKTSEREVKFPEFDFNLPSSSGGVNGSSEETGLISDLDLDNLDLDSATDPVDLDSLDGMSVDLKLDDL